MNAPYKIAREYYTRALAVRHIFLFEMLLAAKGKVCLELSIDMAECPHIANITLNNSSILHDLQPVDHCIINSTLQSRILITSP